MPTNLLVRAIEQSTYFVDVSFTDEDGDPVVPKTLTWSLLDPKGNVINNRAAVEIAPPDSSVTIVLSGNDLDIDANGFVRHLLIEATYDSSLGSDLDLRDRARFLITDLVGV